MVCQYLVRSLDCDNNGHIFQQLLRQLPILEEPLKEFANGTFGSDKYFIYLLLGTSQSQVLFGIGSRSNSKL
jgi:hypothetical protein